MRPGPIALHGTGRTAVDSCAKRRFGPVSIPWLPSPGLGPGVPWMGAGSLCRSHSRRACAARNLVEGLDARSGRLLFVESSACISDTVARGFKLQPPAARSPASCSLPTYNVSMYPSTCLSVRYAAKYLPP